MTNGPDRWSTIAQLADLARDTDDAPTRARLLDAIEAQAEAGALDGPRAPSWGERLAVALPDTLAVVGLLALGAHGTLEGTTAAALALAVLTGRLSPTVPRGAQGLFHVEQSAAGSRSWGGAPTRRRAADHDARAARRARWPACWHSSLLAPRRFAAE